MSRPELWLLIGALDRTDICYAAATTAWVAREKSVLCECYFECWRDGRLFAKTGSTIIGGNHHQQFNYLNARADVKILELGKTHVFASSIDSFGNEKIIQADTLEAYYEALFSYAKVQPECALIVPDKVTVVDKQVGSGATYQFVQMGGSIPDAKVLDIAPYIHSEIYFSHAAAYPENYLGSDRIVPGIEKHVLWMDGTPDSIVVDEVKDGDDYGTLTMRLAKRWEKCAKGVAFGDPDAIRAQISSLCMDERVSVYAPVVPKKLKDVVLTSYAESVSAIAYETADLALRIGNPVLVGRQTGDGDLFAWGSKGVSIQIMDPNRPAFPVVEKLPHIWHREGGSLWENEPDDATLEKWADEGKILSSLVFHSGEMAHNEAMLNLMDYCNVTGLKLGLGAHLKRYLTCPQMWELLNIPRDKGGVRGLIEPLLHSGGLGIMAEKDCPQDAFRKHCEEALSGIERITGKEALPRGYYFFCDTDLHTLQGTRPDLYSVLSDLKMEYAVTNAWPGRNRLMDAQIPVLTQNSRTICSGSPFVRITSKEDVFESGFTNAPGWFIGVLDSPVIAFTPYIWQEGTRFTQLVHVIKDGNMINVLPETIARYAKILARKGYLPEPIKS